MLKQEHRPTTPKLRLRVSHIFLSHKVSKLSQIDILVYMEKIIRILLAKHIFFPYASHVVIRPPDVGRPY